MGNVWVAIFSGALGGAVVTLLRDLWYSIFFRKEYLGICKKCGLPVKALIIGWHIGVFGNMDIKTYYDAHKLCCEKSAKELSYAIEDICDQEIAETNKGE